MKSASSISTRARRAGCSDGSPRSPSMMASGIPSSGTRGTSVADRCIPVVILCGGAGTRLAEQTELRPKPPVEIGGRPILWHIMKHYSTYGFNEFVLALGYKGDQIKRYFLNYHAVGQDMTVNLGDGSVNSLNKNQEPWTVHLVDTGESTLTGGRLRQMESLIGGTFMLTYGDGVSN